MDPNFERAYGQLPFESWHVLLLEDQPTDAAIASHVLARAGVPRSGIVVVDRLSAAIDALRRQRFDVALIDLNLPDSGGVRSVETICRSAPEVAAIALTSADDPADIRAVYTAGAVDHLANADLTPATLQRSLRHAVMRNRHAVQMRSLLAQNIDPIVVADADGEVGFANLAAEQLFGWKDGIDEASLPFQIGHGDTREFTLTEQSGARAGGTVVYEASARYIDWRGEAALMIRLRDVTETRRAAETREQLIAADKLSSLAQMATSVAHEINNPAAIIHLNLRMAEDELQRIAEAMDDPALQERIVETQQMLGDAVTAAARIAASVRDLQTWVRTAPAELEDLDINTTIERAVGVARSRLSPRAECVVELHSRQTVRGDPIVLGRLLLNLLSNATDAIADSGGRGRLDVSSRDVGERVHIEIADDGSGIPDSIIDRVFEPLFTTKGRGVATGLGLSTARELTRQMGGDLQLRSNPTSGTSVRVTLPAIQQAAVVSKRRKSGLLRVEARLTILVVDDDMSFSDAVVRLLGGRHQVEIAKNAPSAYEAICADPGRIDVLLCGLQMRGMDALEIHRRLVELSPNWTRRIIVTTGGVFSEREKQFVAEYGIAVLHKPMGRDHLARAIAAVAGASVRRRIRITPHSRKR